MFIWPPGVGMDKQKKSTIYKISDEMGNTKFDEY